MQLVNIGSAWSATAFLPFVCTSMLLVVYQCFLSLNLAWQIRRRLYYDYTTLLGCATFITDLPPPQWKWIQMMMKQNKLLATVRGLQWWNLYERDIQIFVPACRAPTIECVILYWLWVQLLVRRTLTFSLFFLWVISPTHTAQIRPIRLVLELAYDGCVPVSRKSGALISSSRDCRLM
jgi:hypothetical protein